jgi:uncharacterized protein (TIGR00730 family)
MARQGSDRDRATRERDGASAFFSAEEDRQHTSLDPQTPQTSSPAYRLGFADPEFLLRDELRPARLELEYLKPEIIQRDRGITTTVVIFGSARIPSPERAATLLEEATAACSADPGDAKAVSRERIARALVDKSRYYDEARRLARLISEGPASERSTPTGRPSRRRFKAVIVTGGGPGIMEAANRGAHDAGAESIGLNIVLPFEQRPNEYISPDLCFNFHYFALRKMHFMMRAKALVVFPGGFGTFDELFEVLCLIQTRKVKPMPVLLFGREYWEKIINFQGMVDEGVINPEDLGIFSYVETAEEAWRLLEQALTGKSKR